MNKGFGERTKKNECMSKDHRGVNPLRHFAEWCLAGVGIIPI